MPTSRKRRAQLIGLCKLACKLNESCLPAGNGLRSMWPRTFQVRAHPCHNLGWSLGGSWCFRGILAFVLHACGKAKAFKETAGHASLEFAALRIDSPCPRRCQGYASCSSCQVLSVQICFECMKAVHEGNANLACAVAQVCFIFAFAHALLKSRLSLLAGRMFNLSLQSAPIEVWCCELPSLR